MEGTAKNRARSAATLPRHPAFWYAYIYLAPGLAALGVYLGGWWTFLALAYGFGINPVIDTLGRNRFGRAPRVKQPPAFRSYEILTYLMLPAIGAMVAYAVWFVGLGGATAVETVGTILSCGIAAGAGGITTAHELVHRPRAWQRGIGVAILYLVNYAHFRIEHVHGHHKHVGTPRDPATARYGESVHAFIPRSIAGQWLSSWKIENERLRRRGHAVWGPRNRMIWYTALPPLIWAALWLAIGPMAVVAFVGQSVIAVVSLETVNYLEHYGLERREIAPGKYEPFGPFHAWNSAHPATDAGLFNLGRHSAHHLEAHFAYPELDNLPDWPQLPNGYAGSYLLALVPPLWRRVMHPRIEAVNAARDAAGKA